ncbi:MAG: sn-glycerol-3-phosphate ABC transporter ATP-binding protein UgpC [Gammaproteobacteria bacterium]
MARIVLQELSKKFGNIDAVRGINLVVENGEFAVLVGPSGCGKTTTLRMIAGLEEISQGSVSFDGTVINDLPPKARDVAMVFQSYALYPNMTVAGNMAFSLKMKGVARADRKQAVQRAAELLGITELLERKPRELSGGQRQRVAMGRAIVRKPSVFLFDEPLSNLDAALRAQMRVEIKKIHQRLNTTVVYVTHDQIEAMTLADRIVVMNEGKIEQVGTPLELYRQPANRFVASFIGSPRMNLFPGKLVDEESGLVVELKGGARLAIPVERRAAYRLFLERDIEMGLRPEHLTDQPEVTGTCAQFFDVMIDVVEPMGANSLIAFSISGREYVAVGQPSVAKRPGETLRLQAAMANMHLIDVETGKVVTWQTPCEVDGAIPSPGRDSGTNDSPKPRRSK